MKYLCGKKMLPISKNPHEILCMDCTFLLYLKYIDLPMNEYDILSTICRKLA